MRTYATQAAYEPKISAQIPATRHPNQQVKQLTVKKPGNVSQVRKPGAGDVPYHHRLHHHGGITNQLA
ncbi:hypothetical protein, partial [Mycobacterium sp.]|uniref:hypothetical protein n=1 Tax=Mycobacterium sp. TaxID=1785 RepID=UPI0025E2CB98